MTPDVADFVGTAIGKATREAARSLSKGARKRPKGSPIKPGTAAGLGLAAVTPFAAAAAGKAVKNKVTGKLSDGVDGVKDDVKDAVKDKIPGAGGKKKGVPGVGKGRRMPIQMDIDIGAPVKMVYN